MYLALWNERVLGTGDAICARASLGGCMTIGDEGGSGGEGGKKSGIEGAERRGLPSGSSAAGATGPKRARPGVSSRKSGAWSSYYIIRAVCRFAPTDYPPPPGIDST